MCWPTISLGSLESRLSDVDSPSASVVRIASRSPSEKEATCSLPGEGAPVSGEAARARADKAAGSMSAPVAGISRTHDRRPPEFDDRVFLIVPVVFESLYYSGP